MYLLAKDGIYIRDYPRKLTKALLAAAGRADLMVRCNQTGTYEIKHGGDTSLVTINVEGNEVLSEDL